MILTRRAIGFAVLAYFSALVIGILLYAVLGFDPTGSNKLPVWAIVASIVSSVVFAAVFTYLYFTFKNPGLKVSREAGFKFGLAMVVVGFALDMLFFLPLIITSGSVNLLLDYYGNPLFYLALIGVVAAASGTGAYLKKKAKKG